MNWSKVRDPADSCRDCSPVGCQVIVSLPTVAASTVTVYISLSISSFSLLIVLRSSASLACKIT